MLGAPGSGKTSLIQTLVDQQPRLTTAEEVTLGLDIYDLSFEVENTGSDEKFAEPPVEVAVKVKLFNLLIPVKDTVCLICLYHSNNLCVPFFPTLYTFPYKNCY